MLHLRKKKQMHTLCFLSNLRVCFKVLSTRLNCAHIKAKPISLCLYKQKSSRNLDDNLDWIYYVKTWTGKYINMLRKPLFFMYGLILQSRNPIGAFTRMSIPIYCELHAY